jgi:uncharacterized membrane protein HdeD (DUF308 family)
MEKKITKSWYMILIKGIILTALSFFVLFNPKDTFKIAAFYLGVGFFIMGIILVIKGLPKRKEGETWNWEILEGIGDLILGFLLIAFPMALAAIIPILMGIWAGFYGIIQIIDSFKAKDNRMLMILVGIVIILLAGVLIFNPLLMGLTIAIWLGVLLLVAGVYNIYLAIKIRQAKKEQVS